LSVRNTANVQRTRMLMNTFFVNSALDRED